MTYGPRQLGSFKNPESEIASPSILLDKIKSTDFFNSSTKMKES